ncbi:SBBP repeat-containing protein [Ammoniphilus sp. YIM 78166]|uniref:DUF7948 domain-containing protein n=1 Tax=Ammoniphilus sp. YIM 78166 TaxID=1644106 RepID=UPI0010704A7B|nr:SBBP repeat-containing protein [Ammoniphilus sp. YIM 78166]
MAITMETHKKVWENYAKLPLAFVPNAGQVYEKAQYYVQRSGYGIYFTPGEAVFAFRQKPVNSRFSPQGLSFPSLTDEERRPTALDREDFTLSLRFLHANPSVQLEGRKEGTGKVNYFLGNHPEKWFTDLPTYHEVVYRELWPGVDLLFRGDQGSCKYELILQPGAPISLIRLSYQGAERLSLDENGNLQIHTPIGVLLEERPVSYQEKKGQRIAVASSFKVMEDANGEWVYGFQIGEEYDPGYPLIIDPTLLAYSTYLGGSGFDSGAGIAVDSSGAAYVTGITNSPIFPTQNPFQVALNGVLDAFVAKLDPTGTSLVYSTYLGGSGSDQGLGIDVDSSGAAYVTGQTNSPDFPRENPFQADLGGDTDAFVTKLSPAGNTLIYSTYLGGSEFDAGYGIAVDSSGAAYVTGETASSDDFPTQIPVQGNFGGDTDAFVAKLDPTGTLLVYSTYLGGSNFDFGFAIAVDNSGAAYVTGQTASLDFPMQSPFQGALTGNSDAFITKLDPTGTSLVYSTYLGGSNFDRGFGIAVDSSGAAYVTGETSSLNFPMQNPFQGALAGNSDAFITKLDPTGTSLVYSTYLGGSNIDIGFGIAVDSNGAAYVTGQTISDNFPTMDPILADRAGGSDVFVTKLSPAGDTLVYSTYLGGSLTDIGSGIAVDSSGAAYVTGQTASPDFPTQNPFQEALAGNFDAFVLKILQIPSPPPTPTPAPTPAPGPTIEPLQPECIRVQKVFDWVYLTNRYQNKIQLSEACRPIIEERLALGHRLSARCITNPDAFLPVFPLLPKPQPTLTPIGCPGARCDFELDAAAPVRCTVPDGTIVTLQAIPFLFTVCIRIDLVDTNAGDEVICSEDVFVQFREEVALCWERGLNIQCRILDVICNASFRQLGAFAEPGIFLTVHVCKEIQVEAEVKLELPARFCQPRRPVECEGTPFTDVCPPLPSNLFPAQCPRIFPNNSR